MRQDTNRAVAMDEMNANRGDFSYQKNLVKVLERKTTLASCWIAIDDNRLAVDIWKAVMSGLIEIFVK